MMIQVGLEQTDSGTSLGEALTYADMLTMQLERDERMQTTILNQWFPVTDLNDFTILGSFAWSSPSVKKKWIIKTQARFDAAWHTPADRARDYLKVHGFHKQRRRVTTSQYHALFDEKRSHPLYAIPCTIEDAYYIDIRSAYWSILSVVGWDVDYNPAKWIGVSSSVLDFPFKEDKLARNSLVSVGLPSLLRVWTGEKLAWAKRPNPFINGVLWSLVHDVLHAVALDVVAAGAVYVHTDGYIVSADHLPTALQAIEAWGLPTSIKDHGKAVIRGAADYDIGGRAGKRRARKTPTYFTNLRDYKRDWLRAKFSRWASRVGG